MEIMSLTIAVEFIVQTLGLAYAPISNKSTQARIFIRVAIAAALFGFFCSVVSITIKKKTNSKKWADYVLDLAIVLDVFCVLFQAARFVPLHFLPLTYVANVVIIVVIVIIVVHYRHWKVMITCTVFHQCENFRSQKFNLFQPISDRFGAYFGLNRTVSGQIKKGKKKRVMSARVAASMATQHIHVYWTWVLQPNHRTHAFQLIIDIIHKYHNYR